MASLRNKGGHDIPIKVWQCNDNDEINSLFIEKWTDKKTVVFGWNGTGVGSTLSSVFYSSIAEFLYDVGAIPDDTECIIAVEKNIDRAAKLNPEVLIPVEAFTNYDDNIILYTGSHKRNIKKKMLENQRSTLVSIALVDMGEPYKRSACEVARLADQLSCGMMDLDWVIAAAGERGRGYLQSFFALDEEQAKWAKKQLDYLKMAKNVITLWERALEDTPFSVDSYSAGDFNCDKIEEMAHILGIDKEIEALLAGVPLQDILI